MTNTDNKQEFNLSEISNGNVEADFTVQNKTESPIKNEGQTPPEILKKSTPEQRQIPISILEANEDTPKSKMFTIALAFIAMIFVLGTGFIIFKYFQNYLGSTQERTPEIAVVDTNGSSSNNDSNIIDNDYDGIEVSGISPLKSNTEIKPTPTVTTPTVTTPSASKDSISSPSVEKSSNPTISKPNAGLGHQWKANDYKIGDIKSGSYKVVSGDTLWEIAQATYGNGSMWTKIASANHIGTSAQGYPLITPGMTLTIP